MQIKSLFKNEFNFESVYNDKYIKTKMNIARVYLEY